MTTDASLDRLRRQLKAHNRRESVKRFLLFLLAVGAFVLCLAVQAPILIVLGAAMAVIVAAGNWLNVR